LEAGLKPYGYPAGLFRGGKDQIDARVNDMPKLTPSGKPTKLGDFENKVSASSLPGGKREKYAIANKVGLMRGNKATAKGKQAAKRK
jgi:hypothetical protein